LSRNSNEYRGSSSVAEAARQLEQTGKSLRPGQTVRFVYTRGEPGVHAWDLPGPLDPRTLDTARYVELLLRAVHTVLTPFGFSRQASDEWLLDSARSVSFLEER
jgi:DNA polymerase elongation subunit (family B)